MAFIRSLLLLLTASFTSLAAADNSYPIILVHGFAGWGRNELLGIKYWGSLQGDLEEQLRSEGYTVYTAAVGPFSSNWDRACELYARIKGGNVNYGKKHSSHFGHEATAGPFEALYPEWGEKDKDGNINKVHLVGHSMGGQTIKMLAHLLAKGTAGAPVEEDPSSHELFTGGHDWVASVTTISTPNQGTLLANGLSSIGDFVKHLLVSTLSLVGVGGEISDVIYNADLEQWGLESKRSGESIAEYIERVFASRLFKPGFKDISLWSLSTDGAAEENAWVTTLPNVYYFSFSTSDTHASFTLTGKRIQKPNRLTMFFPFQVTASFLGGRYGPDNGFSEDWQTNDGVVNTIAMGNLGDGNSVSFHGNAIVGTWNEMEALVDMDHLAVTGLTLHTQISSLYTAHAQLLYSLDDPVAVASTLVQKRASNIENAIASLKNAATSIHTRHDLETLCVSNANNKMARNYCQQMLNSYEDQRRRLRFEA